MRGKHAGCLSGLPFSVETTSQCSIAGVQLLLGLGGADKVKCGCMHEHWN